MIDAQTAEFELEEELTRLRESELLLHVIADNVPDLIAVVAENGRRIWNNHAYAERLGYDPAELRETDSMVEIHPDDLGIVKGAFLQAMAEGRGPRIEYRMKRRDGSWIPLESEGRAVENWAGHRKCLVIVARDISERKRRELEEQRLTQLQTSRAKALSDLACSEDLQSGNLKLCFSRAVQATLQNSQFQRASVWMLNAEKTVLSCMAFHGNGEEHGETITAREHPDFFKALSAKRLLAISSLRSVDRTHGVPGLFQEKGAAGLVCVPFRRGCEILGTIVCERTDFVTGWDPGDASFATALADALVLAIDARERLDAHDRLAASQKQLAGELNNAAEYVRSLLPAPMKGEIEIDWRFTPSEALGGDAFCYHPIDEEHLAIYLLDVVGHGVRAALLSVTAIHQLLKGFLDAADLLDPKKVLTKLNDSFQMDECDGMYFTLWYGVYNKPERRLSYASAGHPPALLFAKDSPEPQHLHTPGLMIGGVPFTRYESRSCEIEPGSQLFVFSDGVYEIPLPTGKMGTLRELIANLAVLRFGDLDRVIDTVRAMQAPGQTCFDDDVSLMRVTFH